MVSTSHAMNYLYMQMQSFNMHTINPSPTSKPHTITNTRLFFKAKSPFFMIWDKIRMFWCCYSERVFGYGWDVVHSVFCNVKNDIGPPQRSRFQADAIDLLCVRFTGYNKWSWRDGTAVRCLLIRRHETQYHWFSPHEPSLTLSYSCPVCPMK